MRAKEETESKRTERKCLKQKGCGAKLIRWML